MGWKFLSLERFEPGRHGIAAGWHRKKRALSLLLLFGAGGVERWIEWLSIGNSLTMAVVLLADGFRSVLKRLNGIGKGEWNPNLAAFSQIERFPVNLHVGGGL